MQKISAGKFHFEPPSPLTSFDHLVGAGEQGVWNGQSKSLGGLDVDHQLILGRGLHREVGRLLALEDAIDITGCTPGLIEEIGSKADETAGKSPVGVDSGQSVSRR